MLELFDPVNWFFGMSVLMFLDEVHRLLDPTHDARFFKKRWFFCGPFWFLIAIFYVPSLIGLYISGR